MVQPASITEREAAGGQKKSAPTLTVTLSSGALVPSDVAKWAFLTKQIIMLVVVVVVVVVVVAQ
jgi:hypothetical protein